MKRFILQIGNNIFAKWIFWTAGTSPLIREGTLDNALIVTEEFLNSKIKQAGYKTRKGLLLNKYPEMKIIEVKVLIANN